MSAPMFLVDPEGLRAGHRVLLDGDEGRHASVVRRIGAGETVELTDGRGHVARCVVTAADRTGLLCDVVERVELPPPAPRLVVVQALPKGDRAELAVAAMTEVGVDEIVAWFAQRCATRWRGERGIKAFGRWQSSAREAAKQSRRAWLPDVTGPADTGRVAERIARADLAVVLHEEAPTPLAGLEVPDDGEIVLVVGPEGGIAPAEVGAFAAVGAVVARLGPTVLRTSTAGAVAAGIVLSRTRRWS